MTAGGNYATDFSGIVHAHTKHECVSKYGNGEISSKKLLVNIS